jgi:hypothetical protein
MFFPPSIPSSPCLNPIGHLHLYYCLAAPSHVEVRHGSWLSFLPGLLTLADGTNILFRNVGKLSPDDAV